MLTVSNYRNLIALTLEADHNYGMYTPHKIHTAVVTHTHTHTAENFSERKKTKNKYNSKISLVPYSQLFNVSVCNTEKLAGDWARNTHTHTHTHTHYRKFLKKKNKTKQIQQ